MTRGICARAVDSATKLSWYVFAASVLAATAGGVLLAAYFPCLATFVRSHGVGPALLKFLPLAAFVSAVVALANLLIQVRRARFNQRIDLILKLSERFDKAEMRAARAKAAKALRVDRDTTSAQVGEVLSFFEEVGFLLERGAIDVDAVYQFFEYWTVPYYQATTQFRARERASYGDLYSELEKLRCALARSEPKGDRDEGDLNRFLDEEAALAGVAPHVGTARRKRRN